MMESIKKKLKNAIYGRTNVNKDLVPINACKACQNCEINKLFILELKKRWKFEESASQMPQQAPQPENIKPLRRYR